MVSETRIDGFFYDSWFLLADICLDILWFLIFYVLSDEDFIDDWFAIVLCKIWNILLSYALNQI